jgi:hypothetical protein
METEQTTRQAENPVTLLPAVENSEKNVKIIAGSPYEDEKGSHKLTDEQFIAELELNLGLYTQTARSIERHYGISFSRQAVYDRAMRLQRFKSDFRGTIMDNAKDTLFQVMNQPDADQKLKVKVALFLLGKKTNDLD